MEERLLPTASDGEVCCLQLQWKEWRRELSGSQQRKNRYHYNYQQIHTHRKKDPLKVIHTLTKLLINYTDTDPTQVITKY